MTDENLVLNKIIYYLCPFANRLLPILTTLLITKRSIYDEGRSYFSSKQQFVACVKKPREKKNAPYSNNYTQRRPGLTAQ